MSTSKDKRLYLNRLDGVNKRVSSLMLRLNTLNRRVTNIDEAVSRLPTRIQQIRKENYRVMTSLEKDSASLSERWIAVKPTVTSIMKSTTPNLVSEGGAIKNELAKRRGASTYEISQLADIEFRVSTLNAHVSDLTSNVGGAIGDSSKRLQSLDRDIAVAERTLSLTASASFLWKQGESPILSVNAKDLNNDVKGVLSLTNQRFIFEMEEEVVLKKMLFIATQKKKVRKTIIDKPIGMVEKMVKGRVGLLAGQGLYITFKPNSGLQEMKLDTKGDDTDLVLRFHKFISTGEAEQELATLESPNKNREKPIPIICSRCGAPYTEEIYRGQTSLQCKYCYTTIPVSR